jgi:protein TonB
MIPKKTKKGNLENRRVMFGLIGLVLVLGLVYVCFEFFAPQKSQNKFASSGIEIEPFTETETPIADLTPPREKIPQEPLKDWIIRIKEGTETTNWEEFIKSLNFGDILPDVPKEEIEIIPEKTDPPPVLPYSDVMPKYPGGDEAMYAFLKKHLIYPQRAIEASIQGISLIEFVVEKDGSVSNTKALSSLHPDCDNEAMRVIKMLKFSPGLVKNEPVRVYYMIPVQFVLQ